jgi:hypothetical protein
MSSTGGRRRAKSSTASSRYRKRTASFAGWTCIDTYVWGGGWLTALDVPSNHVYQANESGLTREFPLAKFS